jgi:hypothetical protein
MRAGFSAVCPHPDPLPEGEGEKQCALFDGRVSTPSISSIFPSYQVSSNHGLRGH